MTITLNPPSSQFLELTRRPAAQHESLESIIAPIFSTVQENGDIALRNYARQFDKADIDNIIVRDEEFLRAEKLLSHDVKQAIRVAAENISKFHTMQFDTMQVEATQRISTMPGVVCWRKSLPIGRVGLYIPGGTAPLFSTVLMLGIPARIAGSDIRILCTPPSATGDVHPAILYAAQTVGIRHVYKAGGAQAIAAMTFGTESVPAVHKIFGPGNKYVVAAKHYAQQYGVAIDMPAGPSEVLVIADDTANPRFVAADLLAQAEHDIDAQVMLITTSLPLAEATLQEIDIQLSFLPRKETASRALNNSRCIVVETTDAAIALSNLYAPEHLIIATHDASALAERITDAGSIFIGHYTPESVGDYASGTNHTLPTNGYARSYSGVSIDSFMKKITLQSLTNEGLQAIAPTVITMAQAEGLDAHAQAVAVRLSV